MGMTTALMALMAAVPAQATQVALDVALSSASALANTQQTAYLRVAMSGREFQDMTRRPPINVAIVLDKSGSMQGEKLARAKEAAIMVIERLRQDDIISVVAYDSQVVVLVPATKVSDQAGISAAIRNLQAGSATALFAGVSKGAAEVRKFLNRERVNRVILLSDGLANEGPSSPGALAELGASLNREGISVTTIGLGLDYNEDLMAALARESDGNHMFAEKAQDLAATFEREFGDLLAVVAKDISVTIKCEPGVRPVRALGREASISGGTVYAGFNQIYGGQTRYVLLEVELTPGSAGSRSPVAQVDVSFLDMASSINRALQNTVMVSATDSKEQVKADENREVMTAVVYQISTERNELAMRLRDEGKVEEGKQVLRENLDYLQSNELTDAPWYQENVQQLGEMDRDEEEWRRTRKSMIKGQYEIKQQMKN